MQKLCRHEYFGLAHILLTLAVRAVVHCLIAAEVALRMQHRTLLNVPFVELAVKFGVPSLLVSVAPPYYRRMINVAYNHLTDKFLSVDSFVMTMPSA